MGLGIIAKIAVNAIESLLTARGVSVLRLRKLASATAAVLTCSSMAAFINAKTPLAAAVCHSVLVFGNSFDYCGWMPNVSRPCSATQLRRQSSVRPASCIEGTAVSDRPAMYVNGAMPAQVLELGGADTALFFPAVNGSVWLYSTLVFYALNWLYLRTGSWTLLFAPPILIRVAAAMLWQRHVRVTPIRQHVADVLARTSHKLA